MIQAEIPVVCAGSGRLLALIRSLQEAAIQPSRLQDGAPGTKTRSRPEQVLSGLLNVFGNGVAMSEFSKEG